MKRKTEEFFINPKHANIKCIDCGFIASESMFDKFTATTYHPITDRGYIWMCPKCGSQIKEKNSLYLLNYIVHKSKIVDNKL